jgi:hypothetical protein
LLLGPIRSPPFADTASTSQLLSLQSGSSLSLWLFTVWHVYWAWAEVVLMVFFWFGSQKCGKRAVRQAYHNVCRGEFQLLNLSCY